MAEQEWAQITFRLFDTENRISVLREHETLLQDALEKCRRYDALFSPVNLRGDAQRICRAGGSITVEDETAALLRRALDLTAETDGWFDVTAGGMVQAWRIGDPAAPDPDEAQITAALADKGAGEIRISGNTVTVPARVQVDFGGIAKGFIADRLIRFFRENGVQRALIDLGGHTALLGEKSPGQMWKIGVRSPFAGADDVLAVISCGSTSVVTSAAYERFRERDGTVFSHIMDPFTGRPAQTDLLSATVVCPDSTLADALSTACYAAGMQRGKQLLKHFHAQGAQGLLIGADRTVYLTRELAAVTEF